MIDVATIIVMIQLWAPKTLTSQPHNCDCGLQFKTIKIIKYRIYATTKQVATLSPLTRIAYLCYGPIGVC